VRLVRASRPIGRGFLALPPMILLQLGMECDRQAHPAREAREGPRQRIPAACPISTRSPPPRDRLRPMKG